MPSAGRCVVLQHFATEGPERIAGLAEQAGLAVEMRALYRGEPVPRSLPPETLLVVMGGPMGVGDVGDPAYPYLGPEIELLRGHLAADAPVLGVCLGAQLLAHAAGARVYPNARPLPDGGSARVYEVGWAPVRFHGEGDPALEGMGPSAQMLHWHGDTFDLPAGAVHLASTPACPNQAFRLGRAVALQFHPELEQPTVEDWLRADADYVVRACGPEGADRIRAETARYYPEYRAVGDRLLGNIIGCLLER